MRLPLVLLLVLVSPSIVAERAATDSCTAITELSADAEIQTLHTNLLCLHQRIENLSDLLSRVSTEIANLSDQSAERSDSAPSRYVSLASAPIRINPCVAPLTSDSTALCQQRLFNTFDNLCVTGDCRDGLKPFF